MIILHFNNQVHEVSGLFQALVSQGKRLNPSIVLIHLNEPRCEKPVFGVSDQVPHKPGCKTTQDG